MLGVSHLSGHANHLFLRIILMFWVKKLVVEYHKNGARMETRHKDGYGEVGLGAWQLGADWGILDDDQAYEILCAARDSGIRFIDTADVYGAGLSEQRIGSFLAKNPKEQFFVATKIGRLHGFPDGYSLSLFRKCVEESCARLQVEQLDLVQLHCVPTSVLQKGDVFDWLRILKKEGLIRNFGASVETTEEARICLAHEDLYSLQIIYNIFRQHPISSIFDTAQRKGVALIVRLPLASGLLCGRFNERTVFPEHDHRNYNRDGDAFHVGETFSGIEFSKAVSLTRSLKTIIESEELPMASFALRWILDHPAVTVVIPGASRVDQVLHNAQASLLSSIPESMHQELDSFFYEQVQKHIRGDV